MGTTTSQFDDDDDFDDDLDTYDDDADTDDLDEDDTDDEDFDDEDDEDDVADVTDDEDDDTAHLLSILNDEDGDDFDEDDEGDDAEDVPDDAEEEVDAPDTEDGDLDFLGDDTDDIDDPEDAGDPEARQRQEESIDAIEQGIAQGITQFTQQLAEALNVDIPDGTDPLQGIIASVKSGPASTAARDLAIHLAVKDTDIDPVALTDSISFTTSLEALNPADADYQAKVAEAVHAAAAKNQTLKKPQAEERSGGDFMSGAGTQPTEDDVTALQRKRRERRKHR